MKCMTVVGTRPEFIQTAPLTKALRRSHNEILVNTGQHYDEDMAQVFFRDLALPAPDVDLGVGSGSHARQTGEIMIQLEPVMLAEKPDWVIVYGDTNSTVAAALVAAKLHIRIAHIEAGLRSFDRKMPEEVNRVITDHISQRLFSPTETAVRNLANEGITDGVHWVGDVRIDLLHDIAEHARERIPQMLERLHLVHDQPFALATIHRPANTDDPAQLRSIARVLDTLDIPVVLPAHPRLRKMLASFDLAFGDSVRVIDPVGFVDMVTLLHACRLVITDSGGLQKEAYMLRRPTVTVRDTTEWVETIEASWNRLTSAQSDEFRAAVAAALDTPPATHPDYYGSYSVSEKIANILYENA